MKKLSCFMMLGAVLGLLALSCEKAPNPMQAPLTEKNGVSSLAKASVFHDNFDFPIVNELAFNPCAGEGILFNGATHVETHTVIDANGGFHAQFSANDHNFSGVGQSSGIKYHRVGATVEHFSASGFLPFNDTFTNTFNFIGQGPGNNFIVQQVFHITVNANGVVTVLRNKLTIECR